MAGNDYDFIHVVFDAIGTDIRPMAMSLLTGLESQYFHRDPRVRDVAITATTQMIIKNVDIFVHKDHLAAVWNLFFLVDFLSHNQVGHGEHAHEHQVHTHKHTHTHTRTHAHTHTHIHTHNEWL